jgi:hypothetical protein
MLHPTMTDKVQSDDNRASQLQHLPPRVPVRVPEKLPPRVPAELPSELKCQGKRIYNRTSETWTTKPCNSRAKHGKGLSGKYCGNHEKVGKVYENVQKGIRHCANVLRCNAILEDGYTNKECPKCRDKDKKNSKTRYDSKKKKQDEERANNATMLTCIDCKQLKPAEGFVIKDRNVQSRRCPECIEKQRIVEANRPERDRKEEYRAYEKLPERKQKKQEWKEANPVKCENYWRSHRLKTRAADLKGYLARGAERARKRRAANLAVSRQKDDEYARSLVGRRATTLRSAKDKGIPYELTDELFEDLSNSECFYCGRVPSEGDFNGLDRLNSSVGYTMDNVRACCKECNLSKGAMWPHDFIAQTGRIVYFHTQSRAAAELFTDTEYFSANGSAFHKYVNRAKLKNLEFTITESDHAIITSQNCYLCGNRPEFGCGIDRYDSNLGYTLENCRPCCATCNIMKRSCEHADFLNRCIHIVNHLTNNKPDFPESVPARPESIDVHRRYLNPSPFIPSVEHLVKLTPREKGQIVDAARMDMGDWPLVSARVANGQGTPEDVRRLKDLDELILQRQQEKLEEKVASADLESLLAKKQAKATLAKHKDRAKRDRETNAKEWRTAKANFQAKHPKTDDL